MSSIYRSEAGARAVRERYRELLTGWPVANTQRHVPSSEGDTFVIVSGSSAAPPVILLHGAGTNSASWAWAVGALAEEFRVFAVDMVGEPGLSAPARPRLAADRYAAWLDSVLDALGLQRVAIVGISLGGWLAVAYASEHPDRVERLFLCCPSGIGRQRKGVLPRAIAYGMLGDWGRRRLTSWVLGPAAGALGSDAPGVDELARLTARHFRPRTQPVPVFDDEQLAALEMPVHVVVGRLDVMLDSAQTRQRLTEHAPRAEVELLSDAGHLVPLHPGVLSEFLAHR